MIFNSSYSLFGDAISATIPAGTTYTVDYALPQTLMIYGAELVYDSAAFGDFVSMQVVDKTNVLGHGADFVVKEWIKKWYVPHMDHQWKAISHFAGTVPNGLYIRLNYTSVGTQDVVVNLNLYLISPE